MRTVVYFGSKEIHKDIQRSARSLVAHTNIDRLIVLADADIDMDAEIIRVDALPWFDPAGPNVGTKWRTFGLIRAAMTKILPDCDKVLSVDADTIITADIAELWDIDLIKHYFAAVQEPYLFEQGRPYYNTGVCMMNLAKLRDGTDDRMIHALNTRRFRYVSQDAMNEICAGNILELPSEYNACRFTAPCANPKILHYADRKDWRGLPEVKRWDNE